MHHVEVEPLGTLAAVARVTALAVVKLVVVRGTRHREVGAAYGRAVGVEEEAQVVVDHVTWRLCERRGAQRVLGVDNIQ